MSTYKAKEVRGPTGAFGELQSGRTWPVGRMRDHGQESALETKRRADPRDAVTIY